MNTPPENPVNVGTGSPWNFDIPEFSTIQLSENFDAQRQDFQTASTGNIEPLAVPADSTNLLNMFGNPQPTAANTDNFNPTDFHLYQSQQSLAPSTFSASSGYINPRLVTEPFNLDDATQHFQSSHPNMLGPEPALVDSSGILNIQSFQRSHNVVAGLLDHFVTMACTLLYYSTILQTWPNSEALDAFSITAINLIMMAHSTHGLEVAEYLTSHVISLIARWVSSQVRYHLEEVLDIARTFMSGFNLDDDNNRATNLFNFRLATQLSAYLHLHSTENGHQRRIIFAYMNPVLLQVIRQAYYSSTTSIARRVYHIFAIYPSLLKDLVVAGFTWTGIIPINAFIMGAIATRQALKEWETGAFEKLTWGPGSRSRFYRLRAAIQGKPGNRAYYESFATDAGKKWHNELRLGQVTPSDPLIPPGDDEGSDNDSVYDHDAV